VAVLDPADLLSSTDAAARLGVSEGTLRRYVKYDWIKPVIVAGRARLYRRSDVDALHRRLHPHEGSPAPLSPPA
jgi:excisionase family DNA binding protein